MAEGRHGYLNTNNGIHIPYQWAYADSTAREAATGLVTEDIGKLARQLDDNSIWMLTATTPTWQGVSGGSSGVALADLGSYARGSIIRGGATDWEAHAAKTDGAILVGDGTDVAATVTPTFTGVHNHGGNRIANIGAATTTNDAVTVGQAGLTAARVPYIGASGRLIDSAGLQFISSVLFINDTANTFMSQGFTINQGANDDEAIAVKSTDVSQPFTTDAEADTYGTFRKFNSASGALRINGYSASATGMRQAIVFGAYTGFTSLETGVGTSVRGAFHIRSYKSGGGTATADPTGNEAIFTVAAGGSTSYVFHAEGRLKLKSGVTGFVDDDFTDEEAFNLNAESGTFGLTTSWQTIYTFPSSPRRTSIVKVQSANGTWHRVGLVVTGTSGAIYTSLTGSAVELQLSGYALQGRVTSGTSVTIWAIHYI